MIVGSAIIAMTGVYRDMAAIWIILVLYMDVRNRPVGIHQIETNGETS
ncbi:hypothetical protein OKW24_000671 [Peribacillus simplex]|nr:hypothetical protein [Peribacillus simplex]